MNAENNVLEKKYAIVVFYLKIIGYIFKYEL